MSPSIIISASKTRADERLGTDYCVCPRFFFSISKLKCSICTCRKAHKLPLKMPAGVIAVFSLAQQVTKVPGRQIAFRVGPSMWISPVDTADAYCRPNSHLLGDGSFGGQRPGLVRTQIQSKIVRRSPKAPGRLGHYRYKWLRSRRVHMGHLLSYKSLQLHTLPILPAVHMPIGKDVADPG